MIAANLWHVTCDKLRRQFPGRLFDLRLTQHETNIECLQVSGSSESASIEQAPRYDVGCIQALPEAVVLELLIADGVIDPVAPLDYYLPEFLAVGRHNQGRPIRVEDTLSHATGYHTPLEFNGSGNFDDIILCLKHNGQSFPPGLVCSWNSLGRHLFEELVRRVVGKDVSELVRSVLHDFAAPSAVVRRGSSGWLQVQLSLGELKTFISRTIAPGGSAASLTSRMATSVPVIRRPLSARSGYPISYAHGLACYPDKLWGQNGIGSNYTLGTRFNLDLTVLHCLALEAPPFARDLVLQLLASAGEYVRAASPAHAVGAIVGCDIAALPGTYTADGADRVEVSSFKDHLTCLVIKGQERVASIALQVIADDILIADPRWGALQIEFFAHPATGLPSLVLGQVSYVKSAAI